MESRTKTASIRIGIDTGGTFTDFVVWRGGRLFNRKVLSTPPDPSLAIFEGVGDILKDTHAVFIVHGTTVATNALLQRKGGRIALVTTAGFEDVLAIGRQTRRNLYALQPESRFELIPAERRFGLHERTLASGDVEKRVRVTEVREIIRKIRRSGAEAVAVCLLHSYANPANEEIVAGELEKAGLLFTVSSRLLPEYREFERTATTSVNAYLMPVMDRYLGELDRRIGGADLRIMQSNEGYISPARARVEPIRTALSGPAGGVVGARALAQAAGFPNVVSFDMGGTSTDVSLIEGGIRRTHESRIGDFPIRLPVIDIHSVGAGGGSIAYTDRGGSLRVGPQSAGADPGPACYGRGDLPAVTDANLCLGRLDPGYFLGGRMRIYPERSLAAVSRLGRAIGKSATETALGIVAIANANMEKAIRVISVERGIDPRSFALLSFGGAGGMHAVEMATHLGMRTVLVPRNAGVLSAFGLLMSDPVKDYTKSLMRTDAQVTPARLEAEFRTLEDKSRRDMLADGFALESVVLERSLDCRYLGQSYEIDVPYRRARNLDLAFLESFHRRHKRLYSYRHDNRPVEIVNLRIKVVAVTPKLPLAREPSGQAYDPEARIRTQKMHTGRAFRDGAVCDRSRLHHGQAVHGPALVIDPESTIFIPPGFAARVDAFLNLVIRRTGSR
ncbi:MAG: hydantoin utilization protein [Candidatus Aminicenantes bacterium]|jgi:N-methylhydantoinase A/oxoprolinase/acetone carboxylase beta subunit|nr:hydantoin utilization protein [Candidatus Aminicenantes bacterium]